jgi:hypothetical protein
MTDMSLKGSILGALSVVVTGMGLSRSDPQGAHTGSLIGATDVHRCQVIPVVLSNILH